MIQSGTGIAVKNMGDDGHIVSAISAPPDFQTFFNIDSDNEWFKIRIGTVNGEQPQINDKNIDPFGKSIAPKMKWPTEFDEESRAWVIIEAESIETSFNVFQHVLPFKIAVTNHLRYMDGLKATYPIAMFRPNGEVHQLVHHNLRYAATRVFSNREPTHFWWAQ